MKNIVKSALIMTLVSSIGFAADVIKLDTRIIPSIKNMKAIKEWKNGNLTLLVEGGQKEILEADLIKEKNKVSLITALKGLEGAANAVTPLYQEILDDKESYFAPVQEVAFKLTDQDYTHIEGGYIDGTKWQIKQSNDADTPFNRIVNYCSMYDGKLTISTPVQTINTLLALAIQYQGDINTEFTGLDDAVLEALTEAKVKIEEKKLVNVV